MSVTLSSGLRSSVNSLTDIGAQIQTSNTRLSTGKKINSAIDNPTNYFLAQGFSTESTNLKNLLDTQNLGLSTITKANDAISQITKLTQSISALIKQAQALSNSPGSGRDTIGSQIATTFNQIDSITRDSGFNGTQVLYNGSNATATFAAYSALSSSNINIITNSNASVASQTTIKAGAIDLSLGGSATSVFGATVTTVATTGIAWTATAGNAVVDGTTGVKYTAGAYDTGTGDTKLAALSALVNTALTNLTAQATALSTQATILQVRQSFTTNTARTNSGASDSLVTADLNEEGANLTALQTRQSFAVTSLQLAGQADKAILRLFG